MPGVGRKHRPAGEESCANQRDEDWYGCPSFRPDCGERQDNQQWESDPDRRSIKQKTGGRTCEQADGWNTCNDAHQGSPANPRTRLTTKARSSRRDAKHVYQEIFVVFVSSWFEGCENVRSQNVRSARRCLRQFLRSSPAARGRRRPAPQRADGADGGGGAGQRRDARHFVHHRRAAHGAIVEERLAAERRVDDEIDLAVDDLVGDVRPPFVHLEHDVDVEAVRAQVRGGAARGDQAEPELGQIARDRQQVRPCRRC